MNYTCGNYITGEDGTKFFVNDNVEVYQDGAISGKGPIKLITSKGIYLDTGGKKDGYFRSDQIDLIKSDGSKIDNAGIPLNEKYVLDTADELNVIVKEKYMSKPDENGKTEEKFKTISYHPSIELAFKSIVNREINMSCAKGFDGVVKAIEDLKEFKKILKSK